MATNSNSKEEIEAALEAAFRIFRNSFNSAKEKMEKDTDGEFTLGFDGEKIYKTKSKNAFKFKFDV